MLVVSPLGPAFERLIWQLVCVCVRVCVCVCVCVCVLVARLRLAAFELVRPKRRRSRVSLACKLCGAWQGALIFVSLNMPRTTRDHVC